MGFFSLGLSFSEVEGEGEGDVEARWDSVMEMDDSALHER